MSYIVGGAFSLNGSSLILQDQIANNTFDSIVDMNSNSTISIYRCFFYNSWGNDGAVLNLIESSFIMVYSVMERTQKDANKAYLIK